MMRRRHRYISFATAAFVAAQSPIALAQDAGDSGRTLEEVVVTAQKRAQSILDVGGTINVLSNDELQKLGIDEAKDLMKTVAGLSISGPSGSEVYTLRGVGYTDTQTLSALPTVTTYIDEVPLPLTTMVRGIMLDVARVEVLKGPQGTLFGSNATGGALNVITNKPTDTFAAGVEASYGNYNAASGQVYISGPITETLKARFAIQGRRSDGWQYSISRPSDHNGGDDFLNARFLLDWAPTEALKVELNLSGWRDKSDSQQVQLLVPDHLGRLANPAVASQADPSIYTLAFTPDNSRASDWIAGKDWARDDEYGRASARIDYAISDALTLSSLTSYTDLDLLEPNGDGSTLQNIETWQDSSGHYFFQELRATGQAEDLKLNYIIGANYTDHTTKQDLLLNMGIRSAAALPFGRVYEVATRGDLNDKDKGVFANVEWEAMDSLTLSAGVRYTKSEHETEACQYDPVPNHDHLLYPDAVPSPSAIFGLLSAALQQQATPNPLFVSGGCLTMGPDLNPFLQDDSFDEDNWSWRLGTVWKLTADKIFYATVSKGYKAGNFPVVSSTTYTQMNPTLQESLLSYEVGTKLFMLDRSLQVNFSTYYYDYKDKQLLVPYVDPIFGPNTYIGNVPKTRVYGAESSINWLPVQNLNIMANVSYTKSEIRQDYFAPNDVNEPVNARGNTFNYTPEWIGNLSVDYTIPINNQISAFVGASAVANDVAYSDLQHREGGKLPAWQTLDLRAGFEGDKWRAFAWGRNVTDENYWSTANPSGVEWNSRLTNMPRTYGVTVSHEF